MLNNDTVTRAAADLGRTPPAQVVLAWTLTVSPPHVLLIPGTSSVAHLEQNLAVAEVELPADVKNRLDSILDERSDGMGD